MLRLKARATMSNPFLGLLLHSNKNKAVGGEDIDCKRQGIDQLSIIVLLLFFAVLIFMTGLER